MTMKASVTPEAHDTIERFLVENGATFGAWVEAFAELIESGEVTAGTFYSPTLDRAREIAAERQRRAEAAQRAYMIRLAHKSAERRRKV